MSNEQNNGGPSDDEIRRLVNLPFNQDENGTEWVTLTPQMLARAVRRALTLPTAAPVDERYAFESEMARRESWTACDFRPHPRRGEYPHPDYLASYANAAWAGWQARAAMTQVSDINVVESFTNDTKDAKRYRWLADSNNYYEAINLISDGSLTEDALGKAIDAAIRARSETSTGAA